MCILLKVFFQSGKAQTNVIGNALLVHGDAVKGIRTLHGTASVGNDDVLGLFAVGPDIIGEFVQVDVIQGTL